MSDSGFIVYDNGLFWAGWGWDKQLRNAKVYHWKSKAEDVIKHEKVSDPKILSVEIKIKE